MVDACAIGTWRAIRHACILAPAQVQAENVQQAEALVRLSNRLEQLDGDMRDTQGLLGALHGALVPSFFATDEGRIAAAFEGGTDTLQWNSL